MHVDILHRNRTNRKIQQYLYVSFLLLLLFIFFSPFRLAHTKQMDCRLHVSLTAIYSTLIVDAVKHHFTRFHYFYVRDYKMSESEHTFFLSSPWWFHWNVHLRKRIIRIQHWIRWTNGNFLCLLWKFKPFFTHHYDIEVLWLSLY